VRGKAALLALVVLPPAVGEAAAAVARVDEMAPYRGVFEQAVAVEAMQQGRFADAVPRLGAAIDAGMGTARVHEALAECLVQRANVALQAGDAAGAEADYRAALPHYAATRTLDPAAVDAVESACNVLAFLGETAEARAVAAKSLDDAVRRGDRRAEERLRALLRALPRD
jgi:tetratricopeptide (TPR) repeat protein